MQKREIVKVFRRRLTELVSQTGRSQSAFAAKAGLDRSTLSQLLSEDIVRLPRAETIAAIAASHGASVDWLLGISEEPGIKADIVSQALLEPATGDPADLKLKQWHEEARGFKVRYVPSTLPDQIKTTAVVSHETGRFSREGAKLMQRLSQERALHAESHDSDIEVCMPRQTVESFARGEGMWKHLGLRERKDQLGAMIDFLEKSYPSYRCFLFDIRECYSSPYTVFGQKRAAVYMGAIYLVFTSSEHVRALTQHFDDLVRHAVVQANDAPALIRRLLKEIE